LYQTLNIFDMSLTCTCPTATSISNITAITCPENVGQIQKMVFARSIDIADVATAILALTWTNLFAAADDTHAVPTPLIDNPVIEFGAIITVGSGNEVRNGIPKVVGSEPTKFSFTLRTFPVATIRSMKELMCEPDLEVIFVNEDGYLIHTVDAATGILVEGFPVSEYWISDKKIGGFNALDEHMMEFSMPENWSDYLTITDPTANFNPLTDW